jgi:EAL domain-containing protein (putative c-di-GMP-specific phosphodiesterase class I)
LTNNFTNIKIDKSLLWDADKDPNSRELLASLTEMIEKTHFVPLQEGVETKKQLTFVTQHGCRLIQGYYFSKALPAPEFMDSLTSFQGVQTAG